MLLLLSDSAVGVVDSAVALLSFGCVVGCGLVGGSVALVPSLVLVLICFDSIV